MLEPTRLVPDAASDDDVAARGLHAAAGGMKRAGSLVEDEKRRSDSPRWLVLPQGKVKVTSRRRS